VGEVVVQSGVLTVVAVGAQDAGFVQSWSSIVATVARSVACTSIVAKRSSVTSVSQWFVDVSETVGKWLV